MNPEELKRIVKEYFKYSDEHPGIMKLICFLEDEVLNVPPQTCLDIVNMIKSIEKIVRQEEADLKFREFVCQLIVAIGREFNELLKKVHDEEETKKIANAIGLVYHEEDTTLLRHGNWYFQTCLYENVIGPHSDFILEHMG
jgi:hypothetical protein